MNNKKHPDDEFVDWRAAEGLPRTQRESNQRVLDPLLAARIERLRLPQWPGLTPEQELQRVRTVENLKIGLRSALLPIILVPLLWLLYLGPLNTLTPMFRENDYFRMVWPSNTTYLANFLEGSYSNSEQCFFFAMTSSMSMVWLVWLIWRIIHELHRKDTFYIRRWLPGFAIVAPICIAGTYFNYFRINDSTFGLSLVDTMSFSVLKAVINISIFYYMIAALLEQVLLYLRRDKTIPPFPS